VLYLQHLHFFGTQFSISGKHLPHYFDFRSRFGQETTPCRENRFGENASYSRWLCLRQVDEHQLHQWICASRDLSEAENPFHPSRRKFCQKRQEKKTDFYQLSYYSS
jgi:hypothetical protein